MPRLDDSAEYASPERRRGNSLGLGKTLHPSRDESLGSTAGSGLGSERPSERHLEIRRQRLHCAGWGCDAHSAQWVNKFSVDMEEVIQQKHASRSDEDQ